MQISYRWRKNSNTIKNANNAEFVFSQLASPDNGTMYNCQVMASSNYLTGTVDVSSSPHTISVTCKLHDKEICSTKILFIIVHIINHAIT